MYLDALPMGGHAIIDKVEHRTATDAIAARLNELGFAPGEPVQIVAVGPMGRDPIAVRLGSTRFALRRGEAARVSLRALT
ncbi:FeoA family protein [Kozakia baliensis]|uniref:FeoA family protein n=1 Tax=Kozakia baliensis TaxID=153496 RepID=UPI0004972A68|nr:FeoA family protein [Kozakia baliensis]AOX18977.1 iron transporter [Kozakia baliensis]